ncbi:protein VERNALIZATION INSENSITIVE 3-like isoform X1 [Zingiber officinale]|uniref:protein VERNALIZATION INSENSITIVE 3-like isoform X1 n=1 Tax=Zingiber officinale TaxID=94328 RepID=UPI001C4AB990|nr:protein VERNALIZATION INSENSITIVE 3-like isoform X1 [Zingiber officinale]XP_042449281.1 protein VERNALIZATION INSENSITIVE 3-like isoform X1 [Zingiber officinale]
MDPPFSGFVLDPSKCRKLSIDEKRELVHELSKWPASAPEKLQTWSRRDLLEILCAEIGKERKYTGLTKQKMIEYLFKIVSEKKAGEATKSTPNPASPLPQPLQKRQRKNDHPLRLCVVTNGGNEGIGNSRYCQNLACRATMNLEDAFCKRCSCCICHKYDDNKDPSLWLCCSSETFSQGNSCGLSCHLECALKNERAGIMSSGISPSLDGSYYCTHCGKVNDLLESWKKQLMIAKDARRVDVLCYRISLCHKILCSTRKYQSLHGIVDSAMKKLEAEVGPIDGLQSMARGIVNRLSVGTEVQGMCAFAINSLDSLCSATVCNGSQVEGKILAEASLTSSSFINFETSSPTSVTLALKFEDGSTLSQEMAGCSLWHRRAEMKEYPKEPTLTVLMPLRSFLVTELTPGTHYMFKVVAFSNLSELGTWELGITTDAISTDDPVSFAPMINVPKSNCQSPKTNSSSISNPSEGDESHNNGTTFTDLNKSPESCFHYFEKTEMHDSEKLSDHVDRDTINQNTEFDSIARRLQDVEPEETPGHSGSALEDEMNSTVQTEFHKGSINSVENIQVSELPKLDNTSNVLNANEMAIVPFERPDQTLPVTPIRLENSKEVSGRGSKLKPTGNILLNSSVNPETMPTKRGREKFVEICTKDGTLEGSYEYCVKVVRWLECDGYIQTNFRVKFLTWFSLRATPQERRVVTVYVNTLIDDPASLAGQLVDTFSETISCGKKPPQVPTGGFCTKLWH